MIFLIVFLLSITASFAAETDNAISDNNITSNTLSTQINVDELQESDTESQTDDNELGAADDGAGDNDDETIGAVNDGSEDILKDTGTFQEITGKINAQSSGGTVTLENINYYRSGHQASIIINKQLTIDGNGAIIDGEGSNTIFSVETPSKVIFKNITIQNAGIHAVYFNNYVGDFEFINCTIKDNTVKANEFGTHGGAAIYFSNDIKSGSRFKDVVFENNKVIASNNYIVDGGALYFVGSANNCVFDNVTFRKNSVSTPSTSTSYPAYGGAIYFASTASNMQFINVTFDENEIKSTSTSTSAHRFFRGAAIYFANTNANNIFTNVNFTRNKLNAINQDYNMLGGAIYFQGSPSNTNFINCTFDDNYAYSGGGIYFEKGTGTNRFNNVTFSNNTANRYGSALYFVSDITGKFEFNDVNFLDNDAVYGGAVYVYQNTPIEFNNVNFIGNTASYFGGAMFFQNSASVSFNKTTFRENTATRGGAIYCEGSADINSENTFFIKNNARYSGGAMYFENENAVISGGMEFINNTAIEYGGALYFHSALTSTGLSNLNFTGNKAAIGGAVVFNDVLVGKTFSNMKFINNNATSNGGAMYFGGADDYLNTFKELDFINNTAKEGGAMYFNVRFFQNEFNNVNFTGNNAKNAGVIYFYNDAFANNFIKTNLFNNSADNYGLIYVYVSLSNSNFFEYCVFENNTAYSIYTRNKVVLNNCNFTSNNNGIFITGTSAYGNTVSNSIFKNNTGNILHSTYGSFIVEDSVFDSNPGTGIFLQRVSATISNTNFTNNKGRSIHQEGFQTTTITGSKFINNTYDGEGAVIYAINTYKNIINDSVFENNSARSNGVIYSYYSLNLNNVNMTNNSAEKGGALYIGGTDNEIINSNFKINNAEYGGAIYLSTSSQITLNRVSFKFNRAVYGSALYNGDNTFTISNSEFLQNKANSTQLYVYFDKFKNKIIVRYTVGDNYINAISSSADLTFENVTYYDYGNGIVNSDDVTPIKSYNIANQSIDLEIYDENGLVRTIQFTTQGNDFVMDYDAGLKHLLASRQEDEYYTYISGTYDYSWGDFEILQSLIINNTDGIVDLTRNYTYTIGVDTVTDGILIDKEITIDGHGYTINALNMSRIFNITSSNVVLKDIKFENSVGENGGAIYADNVNRTLIENSEFKNCAAINGGFIYITGNSNRIINCNFTNNDALTYELVPEWYDDVYDENDDLIGTKVYYEHIQPNVEFISENGGAIYICGDDALIKNSRFNEIFTSNSGAIYANVTNSRIEECDFENCGAKRGGSIYITGESNVITDSNFINNCLSYTVETETISKTVENSVPCHNETHFISTTKYATVYVYGDNITLQKSKFQNLSASQVVSILWIGEDGKLLDCTFDSNLELDEYISFLGGQSYEGPPGSFIDAAVEGWFSFTSLSNVYWTGNNGLLKNNNFTNNKLLSTNGVFVYSEIYQKMSMEGYLDESEPYMFGFNVTMDNCRFINHTAEMAVQWMGANGTMSNSVFENNNGFGSCLMWIGSNGTISNTNFTANRFLDDVQMGTPFVGLVTVAGINDQLINCVFKDNFGAIIPVLSIVSPVMSQSPGMLPEGFDYDRNFGSNIKVISSSFINNTAERGGAIVSQAYKTLISQSNFINNTAMMGGAIALMGLNETIENSTFENNTAYVGGAVLAGYIAYDDWYGYQMFGESSAIKNSTFINNAAEIAGAIYWVSDNGLIDDDSLFMDNRLRYVYDDLEELLNYNGPVLEEEFELLMYTYLSSFDVELYYMRGSGGAILWNGYKGVINNTVFRNNNASGLLWTVTLEDKVVSDYCEIVMPDYDYPDNYYYLVEEEIHNKYPHAVDCYIQDYGTIYSDGYVGLKTVRYDYIVYLKETFEQHEQSTGGAVRWTGPKGFIENTEFIENTADYGGALSMTSMIDEDWDTGEYIVIPSVVNSSKFTKNLATISGGAIFMENGVIVANSYFNENNAIYSWQMDPTLDVLMGSSGGAIFIIGPEAVIYNSNFTQNHADYGGAVIIYDLADHETGEQMGFSPNTNIIASNFTNNTALRGGAVYWVGNDGVLISSSFNINSADYGGAVFTESNLNINANFTNNTALAGGAVLIEGDDAIINSSYFESNRADYGGAAFINASRTSILKTAFIKNTAKYGGAVYWIGNDAVVESAKFLNNTAENGGALYFNGMNCEITDSEFRFNKAGTGSAISNMGDGLNMASSTLLDNQAYSVSLTSSFDESTMIVKAVFIGKDNFINAIYTLSECRVENVTYWSQTGEANTDLSSPMIKDLEEGIEIKIELMDASLNIIKTMTNVTNINGEATFNISGIKSGRYIVAAYHYEDNYYTEINSLSIINVGKESSPINIDAPDIFYRENETVIIKLNEDAEGNVTVLLNNEYYNAFNLTDGEVKFNITGLSVGGYNVTVLYNGSSKYESSNKSAIFNVKPINSTVMIATNGGNYSTNIPVNITVGPYDDVTGNVIIIIQGEFGETILINTTNVLETYVSHLNAGTYNITAYYTGDRNYLPVYNETMLTVNPIDLKPAASASNVTENEATVFTIIIPEDYKGKVNITVGDISKAYDIAGPTQLVFEKLTAGNKTATVKFYGDKNYNNATVTPVNFTVSEETLIHTITVDIPDTTYPNNTTVQVNVSGKLNGSAIITIDEVEFPVTIVNGTGTADITGLSGGAKTAFVNFTSTDAKFNLTAITKFIVDKTQSEVNITAEGSDLIARVTAGATGNVTFYIDDKQYTVNLTEGIARLNGNLTIGTNSVVAIYNGDDNYTYSSNAKNFTIDRKESLVNATASPASYRGEANITVNVPINQKGYVTITVNGKNYTQMLKDGQSIFNIAGLTVNEYQVIVYYLGDDTYAPIDNVTTLNVVKADLNANVVGQNITVDDNPTFSVFVPEDYKGKVNITVDGANFSGDVQSIIKMVKLAPGSKTATVVFWDDANYNDLTLTTSFTVTNTTSGGNGSGGGNGTFNISTVNAENMTRGYNSEFDYQAAFLDKNGNALANAKVTFKVNGKTYDVVTNDDGIAHLSASKLAVGKYNITSINTLTGDEVTRELTIVKRITGNKDITMDYLDGTVFKVKVYGDDGKIAPAGEVIDIVANGVHYVGKVDKNGYASIKIILLPKTYTITAEYKGYKTTNKLKIKQTLKAVKKTVKVKKGKKITLKAKLVWSNGKGIKGKVIKFKFKGKTYKAKTNAKGIAKVTIKKKKVLKKLKKGKKYTVKVTYSVKHKYGNGSQTINDNIKMYVKIKK